jgi:AcrR family transcriptional regulator
MRDIAAELDVHVMTIYNYVGSKEELFGMVVDQVLSAVPLPAADSGSWIERIRILERDARQAMRAHPGLSLSRHSASGQEAMRLAEGVISILREGGFEPQQAIMAFATLYTFMLGQIEIDVLADTMGGEATFEGVVGQASVSRDQLFSIGFDAVIAGIKANILDGESR